MGEYKQDEIGKLEPSSSPILLTDQQQKVYKILKDHSHKKHQYGDWYLGALIALREQGPDYLAQAANSIREIAEKLPEQTGIRQPDSPVPESRRAVTTILELKSTAYPSGWYGSVISQELANALERLEALRPIFDAPPRTKMFMAALEQRDPHKALISPKLKRTRESLFAKLGSFFQNVTHHRYVPAHEEFALNVSLFEELLLSYLSPISASQQSEVLTIIGCPPSADSTKRLNELLLNNSANQLLLLQRIDDPRWLPYLEELEWFKKPREGDQTEDGRTIFRSDPALSCLARLAPKAPESVLKILESIPTSSNPQIPDQIARCIAGIEVASLVPRCLRLLKRVLSKSESDDCVWIEDVLSAWIRIGKHDESISLIGAYSKFLIQRQKRRYGAGTGWQLGEIDRDYVATLGLSHPIAMATVLFSALVSWKHKETENNAVEPSSFDALFLNSTPSEDQDPPTYWLEDFQNRSSLSYDLEQILATRLFEIGNVIFAIGDETVINEFDNLLRPDSWELFARLRWQLYADHPEKTGDRARAEILQRLPSLSLYSGIHGFEMAQMLQEQSRTHGSNFLAPPEVEQFFRNVMEGPIDHQGLPVTEERYVLSFRRKQLDPVRILLSGPARDAYEALAAGYPDLPMSSYKPISSGGGARTVEHVAPKQAEGMASMSDEELWHILNTWKPAGNRYDSGQWWIEESVSALGPLFADLLNSQSERFPASAAWWRNLTRPAVLYTPLERASARITKENKEAGDSSAPTENDWRNWFGLADWIAELGRAAAASESPADNTARPEDKDWNWPRIIAVKFLAAAIDPRFPVPDDLKPEIGRLLQKSVEDPDPRLASKDKPWMEDWLTTAINSVRGTALEYLLVLALTQRKERPTEKPDEWIFNVIQSTLSAENQSPAVFAIMGARLNIALYVYGEQFKHLPDLLLPQDRHDQRNAFILSQVRYGNPLGGLIEILPNYPSNALDCLAELNGQNQGDSEQRGDFGGQLGYHLFFYDWNVCYPDVDSARATVDRYFYIAKPSQRGRAIRDVARIFSQTPVIQENEPLFERVRAIWDCRFAEVEKRRANGTYRGEEVHEELSAFVQWIECECHPFEWRVDRVLQAIKLLEKPPQAASIIRTLETLSNAPEKLGACTEILEALISKESEIVSWTYREKHLKPILNRGLHSGDQAIEERIRRIQEVLLRQGLFEYLELNTAG